MFDFSGFFQDSGPLEKGSGEGCKFPIVMAGDFGKLVMIIARCQFLSQDEESGKEYVC